MKGKTKNQNEIAKPNGAPTSDDSTGQREARRLAGKALRKACPRRSHAKMTLDPKRDPMALLQESNEGRVKSLLPIRFTRMMESPFAFFRGSAILQAHDLQGTPTAGITVQCCGDCHLVNFGGFATPERIMAFDINDFDETLPGPFEWDLKRLATSFVLAARWRGFGKSDAKAMAQEVGTAYRNGQARYAKMSVLDTWYSKITFDEILNELTKDPRSARMLKKDVEKAAQNTSEHVFHKITAIAQGKSRIIDQPPLLYHGDTSQSAIEPVVAQFFKDYRGTLSADRQALFDHYQFVDVAHKVVGVGSVGTRCYVALFLGQQDDHLLLQVKEARTSVLDGRAGPSPYFNQGERVVTGQRLMQSASDIFLGWSHGPHGGSFYVRQLRDMKLAPNLTAFAPSLLMDYARLCGEALARAHAKSGDAATIAGYLGSNESFDEALRDYAVVYADQVEEDYKTFKKAVRVGRFPVETLPSETEQAVR